MKSSHTFRPLPVSFDEPHLVANAGLQVPATLAARLRLGELLDEHVDLGQAAGRANVGSKALTLVNSLLAGGDCIEDADQLRSGSTGVVLGHRVSAPSTLGTFVRSFTWGHVRQLDAVQEAVLANAWSLGASPMEGTLRIDIDSTICETYGRKKQGAQGVNYSGAKGLNPLLAVSRDGQVLHGRLRGGRTNSSRGAGSFVSETLHRVRRAGFAGAVVVYGDSGFHAHAVVDACRRHRANYSLTIRIRSNVDRLIADIDESNWVAIPNWGRGGEIAQVAELPFVAFSTTHPKKAGVKAPRPTPVRLVVERTLNADSLQPALPGLGYRYHAFITNCQDELLELSELHRQHALVETTIRELKYGVGLNHMPSGKFAANAVWLALNLIAHNLLLWSSRLGLGIRLHAKALRTRILSVPGRLVRSGRRRWLRLPQHWPWASQIAGAIARLTQLPRPLQLQT